MEHKTESAVPSSSSVPSERPSGRRGPRRGRKRTRFTKIPPMPVPVRALWETASEEQRRRAHRSCTAILEAWLGKAPRAQIAARLGVTPLRLWQLSQQATAGMLAGLLSQPRRRRAMTSPPVPPEEDPVKLRKRIEQLESELKLADDLIALLRELPGHREAEREPGGRSARSPGSRAHGRRKAKRGPRRPSGGKKAPSGAGPGGSDGGPVAG